MEADLNEALMLLMRYPCPSAPHQPYTLVQDAVYLKASPDIDGGITIVTKYSNRAPPRITQVARPMTPGTPDSHRSRSPFASPATSSVESMLHDAARGVVSRGERWGLNQALRDAVGEVRKNVQGLNSGRGSPRTRSTVGIQPLHRGTKSDVSSNIAANVLRKITALEERNKQLAKMLEGAVADLWKFEKDAAEKKEVENSSLQAFSMAVAKVQFVQVFLQDSTLPLPPDENEQKISEAEIEGKEGETLGSQSQTDLPPLPSREPAAETQSLPDSSVVKPVTISISSPTSTSPPLSIPVRRPTSTQTPPPSHPTTSLTAEHASAPTAASLSASTTTSSRPRIEQSSFSWMLGQAHEDRSGFVNASPFSPNERRYNAAHGGVEKGFLFGEEDEVVGEAKTKEKTKSKVGQVKGRTNSVLQAQEDIDLGDMGQESGLEA
jgi:TBC1 domain family protein 5